MFHPAVRMDLHSLTLTLSPSLAYQKLPLLQADPVEKAHLHMAGCGPKQQESVRTHRVPARYRFVETFLKDTKMP